MMQRKKKRPARLVEPSALACVNCRAGQLHQTQHPECNCNSSFRIATVVRFDWSSGNVVSKPRYKGRKV
jgi:hypothetical protein